MHGLAMHPQASPCDFDVLRISYKLAASPSSDKWSLEVYDKKDIKTYRLVRSRPFVATTTPLNEVVTVVLPKALRVYRGEFLALRCLRGKTSDSESPPPVQLRISSWYEARNAWLSKDTPSSILYENHSEIVGTPESEAAGISTRPAGDPPSAFGCTAISHSRACSGIEDAAGNGEAKDCNAKVGRKLKACPGWSVEGRSIPSSALLHKKWRVVNSSGVHVYSVPSEESGQDPLYCKYFGDIVTEYDRQGEWIQINPKLQDAFESTHTDQWMHIHPGSGGRGLARQDNVPLTDISVGYLVPRKGDRVMRGPSWAYVDQDADKVTGMPGQGVVTRVWNAEDIAQVLWDNGEKQTYWIKPTKRDIVVVPSGDQAYGSTIRWNPSGGRYKNITGCGPDCNISHSSHGPCLMCGNDWGKHSGPHAVVQVFVDHGLLIVPSAGLTGKNTMIWLAVSERRMWLVLPLKLAHYLLMQPTMEVLPMLVSAIAFSVMFAC